MAWRHQFSIDRLRDFGIRPIEPVERTGGELVVVLRTMRRCLRADVVERRLRKTTGIVIRLHHEWRDGADQRGLGDASLAMAREEAHDFSATGRVADMHCVSQLEMIGELREIIGVVIHVVSGRRLRRATMPAPVVRDHPEPVPEKEHHLRIPVVRRQRPSVREHDRLTAPPVLVEDANSVFRDDRVRGRRDDCVHRGHGGGSGLIRIF